MLKLKTLVAAPALLASGLACAVTWTTFNAGSYTVTYDSSTSFGFISNSFTSSGGAVGFEWSVSDSVSLANSGGSPAPLSFDLPSFTLTANPGYALGGSLTGRLGNFTYADFVGTSAITANATMSANGGPDVVLPTTPLTKTVTNAPFLGLISGTASAPLAGVDSFTVKDAWITLSASAGSTVAIVGQLQNKLSFDFVANPVPEPETYALLMAGLGVVGFMARRRRQG